MRALVARQAASADFTPRGRAAGTDMSNCDRKQSRSDMTEFNRKVEKRISNMKPKADAIGASQVVT